MVADARGGQLAPAAAGAAQSGCSRHTPHRLSSLSRFCPASHRGVDTVGNLSEPGGGWLLKRGPRRPCPSTHIPACPALSWRRTCTWQQRSCVWSRGELWHTVRQQPPSAAGACTCGRRSPHHLAPARRHLPHARRERPAGRAGAPGAPCCCERMAGGKPCEQAQHAQPEGPATSTGPWAHRRKCSRCGMC